LIREADGSPTLGLIDYGQIKRLSKETRIKFAKLIIALCEDNRDAICELAKQLGHRTKNMDPEVCYLWAKVSFDQDNPKILGGKHVQLFMEELEARDPVEGLPKDLLMVSRASIILRGLAHAVHQNRSVAQAWRPLAERVLREET
jgi:aarF domain-containing kinase